MCSAVATKKKKKKTNCSVQLEGLFERYSITKPVAVGVIVILYRSKSPSSWTEQLVFFFFVVATALHIWCDPLCTCI